MGIQNAYFDTLSICDRLCATLGSVAPSEIHLFAYLSCLLALYRGRAVGIWGYSFAVTEEGYPYSPEIQEAIDTLLLNGHLTADSKGFLSITKNGMTELRPLRLFDVFNSRDEYIYGACGSTLTLPTGTIHDAISNAPNIRSTLKVRQTRLLLNQSGQNLLHDQFALLSEAVGINVEDLFIPAVVWLTYLLETSKTDIYSPNPGK